MGGSAANPVKACSSIDDAPWRAIERSASTVWPIARRFQRILRYVSYAITKGLKTGGRFEHRGCPAGQVSG
jgi:hypothetical protein